MAFIELDRQKLQHNFKYLDTLFKKKYYVEMKSISEKY